MVKWDNQKKIIIWGRLIKLSIFVMIISMIVGVILFFTLDKFKGGSVFACGLIFGIAIINELIKFHDNEIMIRDKKLIDDYKNKIESRKLDLFNTFLDSFIEVDASGDKRWDLVGRYLVDLQEINRETYDMQWDPQGDILSLLREDYRNYNNIDMIKNIYFIRYFDEIFDRLLDYEDNKEIYNFNYNFCSDEGDQIIEKMNYEKKEIDNIPASFFEFRIIRKSLKIIIFMAYFGFDFVEIHFEDELVYKANFTNEMKSFVDIGGYIHDPIRVTKTKEITHFSKGIWLKYFYIFFKYQDNEFKIWRFGKKT